MNFYDYSVRQNRRARPNLAPLSDELEYRCTLTHEPPGTPSARQPDRGLDRDGLWAPSRGDAAGDCSGGGGAACRPRTPGQSRRTASLGARPGVLRIAFQTLSGPDDWKRSRLFTRCDHRDPQASSLSRSLRSHARNALASPPDSQWAGKRPGRTPAPNWQSTVDHLLRTGDRRRSPRVSGDLLRGHRRGHQSDLGANVDSGP